MALAPGVRIGPYEVVALVGAGGMGEVYRARDPRLNRAVAIKILPSTNADRVRRFEQEAQAAGRISHPNILAVYDVGVDGDVSYLVSELLSGETLRERLRTAPLSSRHALEFAIQIAEGLAAAHAQGVVHRDLKPENLFVTTDNRIKIVDFGIAKLTEDASAATQAPMTEPGMVMGTAGYMAPEQVEGKPADHRADIFAFGAVFYEMLCGARAFGRPTSVESMTAILKEEPPDLATNHPQVPAAVRAVVRQCLAKRPEDRFQSARDLQLALANIAQELGTSAPAAPKSRRRAVAIAALIEIAVVVAVAAVIFWRPNAPGPSGPAAIALAGVSIRSIVVLPLDNFSADPEQEFFSDGMTEALIADLARVGGLRVISRTSAMTYKAAKKPLTQIARELSVDGVVEGSVTRSGDRVRITAQLFDGASERHLWSNTYERDSKDVLALQSEVARAIADEIKITLTPQEQAVFVSARPIVPDAHEAYLKGRFMLAKGTEDGINQSIVFLKSAAAKDPTYAEPYAGLADAYTTLRSTYAPPHVVMPLARTAAAKALALDPKLAAAHVSMGGVLMYYDFDWVGAERELTQAIALSPNLADAHDYYAMLLATQRRHAEAAKEMALARSLDPLSSMILLDAGWVSYLAGNYAEAMEIDRKVLELNPSYWPALRDMGLNLEKLGRFPEAIAALETARKNDPSPTMLEMLGGAYAAAGKTAEARKVLAELEQMADQRYVCPYEVATVHAGLGDNKKAIEWLEKGLKERADCMPWASSDSKLDSIRNDPHFIDIMHRMGIPP